MHLRLQDSSTVGMFYDSHQHQISCIETRHSWYNPFPSFPHSNEACGGARKASIDKTSRPAVVCTAFLCYKWRRALRRLNMADIESQEQMTRHQKKTSNNFCMYKTFCLYNYYMKSSIIVVVLSHALVPHKHIVQER